MGEEANKVINNTCDKLGILASELIPEMGKMKVAELGSACGIAVIILLVAMAMLVVGMKKNKKDWENDGNALMILGGVLIVATVIALIGLIPNFVGWLVSPKAKTFAYVLSKIGGSV